MRLFIIILFLSIFCSCSSKNSNVVQVAQTLVGVAAWYNPQTQLPELELGYARNVVLILPTDANHTNGTANSTPDLIMDFCVDANIIDGIKISDKIIIGAPARCPSNELVKVFINNNENTKALFGK